MKKKQVNFEMFYLIFIFISVIISTIIVSSDLENYSNYSFLAFLPLVFGIGTLIFIKVYFSCLKNIGICILFSTYYFRMVIIPIIMRLGLYSSYTMNDIVERNVNMAILLMSYEFIMVLITLHFSLKKYNDYNENLKSKEIILSEKKVKIPNKLKYIIMFMALFILVCLAMYPKLRYNYHLLIQSKDKQIESVINYHKMLQYTPGIIYWTFSYIADIFRIIIPLILLIKIKKASIGKKSSNLALLYSLGVVILSGVVVTEEVAISIHICIALIIAIIYMYPKKRRFICILGLSIGLPTIFIAILLKVGVDINNMASIMSELSKTMQAYFGGPINVSAAIGMEKREIVSYIPGDIFKNIAFIGYLFKDFPTTSKLFNISYFGDIGRFDQIIPLVGQCYFYFGFILAPLFCCIFSFIAIKFGYKVNQEKNQLKKYTYIIVSILSATTPVLYNGTIFVLFLFKIIVPLFILTIVINKRYII